MAEETKKDSLYQQGKPQLQYVPRYSYPSNESAIVDSPQSSLGVVSPTLSHFNEEMGTPTNKAKIGDSIGNHTSVTGSPLKKTYGNGNKLFESLNRSDSNNGSEMAPPTRGSFLGNTGSYKSGRRQRPRSLYADLDSYINNTAPSLVMKQSSESLNKSNSTNGTQQRAPTINSLAALPDPFLSFSPPGYANKAGNRSSIHSIGSNNSQKLGSHTLSPPPLGSGISRAGSRSEYDNATDFYLNSRSGSPIRNASPSRRKDSSSSATNPFNYTSITMSNPNILQKPAHRRGHRYKHSSVSMNFFQEPKKRAQLNIPTSLPIPSAHEFFESCSDSQKFKLAWCFVHLFYSSIVFLAGFQYSLTCLTTLSHLVFFDSINNFLVVIVEIFKNFEVWEKSSIRFPFGLSRLEVLFGFALSVSLFYVGFDLITHSLEEFVVSLVDQDFNHENHHNHHNNDEHKVLSDNLFLILIFLGIAITLISNKVLSSNDIAFSEIDSNTDNSLRYKRSNLALLDDAASDDIKKDNKSTPTNGWLNYIKSKSYDKLIDGIKTLTQNNSIVKNPIKLLTLILLGYLIFYPYISKINVDFKVNEIQTFVMSTLILYFAFHMMKKISLIILLSFPYGSKIFKKNTAQINEEIVRLDSFKSHYKVDKIIISKINYSLFVILIKIKMSGESDNEEYRLRSDISWVVKQTLLKNNLENRYINFDITLDIDRM